MSYARSLVDQLAEMGLSPADVDRVAFSHMHFDHVGAANRFPHATLLIQRPEYEAAFLRAETSEVFDPSLYAELADAPRELLAGDHDVFGDGRVKILSAPGHTPGHQVLWVDLDERGPVVLAGDLYHFRASRELRRVPRFNADPEQTLASMERIEAIVRETGAELWIEHDLALAEALRLAPASID
jgi:glyoxylase-like metal-dependent hydrolase (beta-lactamase superfamily II)